MALGAAATPLAAPNSAVLTPGALLTATAGLIAFHIGLYTLVGRERKSPYVINSVYSILLFCLIVATIALAATLVPTFLEQPLLDISTIVLIITFIVSGYRVYKIIVRTIYFTDSISFKHLPFIRQLRRRRSLQSPRPNYAHNTIPISVELKQEIITIVSTTKVKPEDRNELDTKSLAIAVQHQGQANKLLAKLSVAFLQKGYAVQYLTASRHPIEFIGYLKEHLGRTRLTWQTCAPARCRNRCLLAPLCISRFNLPKEGSRTRISWYHLPNL